jgi:hypothetical protein
VSAAATAVAVSAARLRTPQALVLEANGGPEWLATSELCFRQPVVEVNPRQVPGFARALGVLDKTDREDALLAGPVRAVEREQQPVRGLRSDDEGGRTQGPGRTAPPIDRHAGGRFAKIDKGSRLRSG